ncbi:MAG: peptidoglycan recognition family protein [Acidobacteriota bacterium]
MPSKLLLTVELLLLAGLLGGELSAKQITDYQNRLNPRFRKILRKDTRFIIIHSTESSLPSALRTLSRGRVRRGSYVSLGGHANYLVARSGKIYRILDPKYRANHAGVSMWDGLYNLSDYSIGIELEGYHNVPFTSTQYDSLEWLLKVLQKRFDIADRDVLEHCRVAYSPPNRFHRSNVRGRKLDPGISNFDRARAGLTDEYAYDPDAVAGRIGDGPVLLKASAQLPAVSEEEPEEEPEGGPESENGTSEAADSGVISADRTAWKIAGSRYNAPTTIYTLPDGKTLRGDEIVDWGNIPAGTRVELDVVGVKATKLVSAARKEVIVPETSSTLNPWKIANALYNSPFTFYLFPDGSLRPGNSITNWPAVPVGTKVLVAYRRLIFPGSLSPLGDDLGDIYLNSGTLYLFPDQSFKSGDQIEDFTQIPQDLLVFAKVD